MVITGSQHYRPGRSWFGLFMFLVGGVMGLVVGSALGFFGHPYIYPHFVLGGIQARRVLSAATNATKSDRPDTSPIGTVAGVHHVHDITGEFSSNGVAANAKFKRRKGKFKGEFLRIGQNDDGLAWMKLVTLYDHYGVIVEGKPEMFANLKCKEGQSVIFEATCQGENGEFRGRPNGWLIFTDCTKITLVSE